MNAIRAILLDAWLAARRLAKSPAFFAPALATVAIGLGAALAIFTLVYGVLLRPLPYPEADRIVSITHEVPLTGLEGHSSSQIFERYRTESRALEEIGAYLQTVVNITYPGEPEQLDVALATPEVFTILGIQPQLGRLFTAEEGIPGAPTRVLISHALWLARFGGDEQAIGKEVELNGRRSEVVGVMPPGFSFPGRSTQLWYNYGPDPLSGRATDLYIRVIGKTKQGSTAASVQQDLQRALAGLEASDPASAEILGQLRVAATNLKDTVVEDVREPLLILLCAVGLLLLAALANGVNLFLIRSEAHQRELAVRRALGATSGKIRRLWLMESLIVSGLGGAVGLAGAALAVGLRFGLEPGGIPRLDDVRMDAASLAVAALLILLTASVIVCALELRSPRANAAKALSLGRGTDTSPSRQRVQRFLVGAQVALALLMLLSSATAGRGLMRVLNVELGFDHERVAALDVRLPFRRYRSYAQATAFHESLMERIQQAPGVIAAGIAVSAPLAEISDSLEAPITVVSPQGGATGSQGEVRALYLPATPSYFETMRIPLLAGKLFEASDAGNGAIPVVISASLAARLGHDPSSARGVRLRDAANDSKSQLLVVGVAGNTVGEQLTDPPPEIVYLPILSTLPADLAWPRTPRLATIVVKTAMDPNSIVPNVREAVRQIDASLPLASIRTMGSSVERARARHRLVAILMALSSAATLLLGVVGIFGITSYAVSNRAREFAIRMALGANAASIQRLVLLSVASVLASGVVVGLALFAGTSSFLRSIVFGVDPGHPWTASAAVLTLSAAVLLAAYLPARRASRTNPADVIDS